MHRAYALIVALAAAIVESTNASARGQSSYTLPELRQSVPASARVVRSKLWSRDLNSPPPFAGSAMPHDMLAVGPSIIAFVSHGRVCGFAPATSEQLWCAGVGTSPVFAGGRVAYAAANGNVEVVDAATGARAWHVRNAVAAWAAGNDFLIGSAFSRTDNAQTMREYDRAGRILWSAQVPPPGNGSTLVLPPYVFRSVVYSGAQMTKVQSVMLLGAGGGLDAELPGAWSILDVQPSHVVYETSPIEEIQDHFITFDIAVADLKQGARETAYHYEPDYDASNALLGSNAFAGRGDGPIRVDGKDVYVTIFGVNIYRYNLSDPKTQRPLLVAKDVQFLGGPYRGWLYVSRPDGVWALKPTADAILSRRIASQALHVSVVADAVYATSNDGEIVGVDPIDGRTVFDARPCGRAGTESGIASAGGHIYVLCSNGAHWSVTAFQRP